LFLSFQNPIRRRQTITINDARQYQKGTYIIVFFEVRIRISQFSSGIIFCNANNNTIVTIHPALYLKKSQLFTFSFSVIASLLLLLLFCDGNPFQKFIWETRFCAMILNWKNCWVIFFTTAAFFSTTSTNFWNFEIMFHLGEVWKKNNKCFLKTSWRCAHVGPLQNYKLQGTCAQNQENRRNIMRSEKNNYFFVVLYFWILLKPTGKFVICKNTKTHITVEWYFEFYLNVEIELCVNFVTCKEHVSCVVFSM